ncbi:MAG: DNA topoisomerase I, partial [Candidatus Korarchaeota archaeon]
MRVIIAEKPSAAEKIAFALSGKKLKAEGKVPEYEFSVDGEKVVVVPAVGHLYTVDSPHKGIPVLSKDLEWKPIKKVQSLIKKFKEYADADEVIVATDYDTEGSLIGYNIVKYALGRDPKDVRRMVFSTMTASDLKNAYNSLKPMDILQAISGETRHEVDYIFGITLSRALMHSLKSAGLFSKLSVGRVQSPTLAFVYFQEHEIKTFVPLPYWKLSASFVYNGTKFDAEYRERIESENLAYELFTRCGESFRVVELKKTQVDVSPPVPMNLSDLQSIAYSAFGFSPAKTLKIAERLYLAALITYPRTSNQQFPESIDLRSIVGALSRQKKYAQYAEKILKGSLVPTKGPGTDPAHPPIHPTGEIPEELSDDEQKLYDLIVRYFLSIFYENSRRERTLIRLDNNGVEFRARGSTIVFPGWLEVIGPYTSLDEEILPPIQEGEILKGIPHLQVKYTSPPSRYNPSSLLKKMEKEEIGTKATRAEIIETLFTRGYIENHAIKITELGEIVAEILLKFFPDLTDVSMTRELENNI